MSTSNSNDNENLFIRPLLIAAFTIGTAFGGGIRYGIEAIYQKPGTLPMSDQVVTQAGYEKLRTDMTLIEARSLLGSGHEVSQSKGIVTSITIEWSDQNGATLVAVFEDGKLTKKAQIRH